MMNPNDPDRARNRALAELTGLNAAVDALAVISPRLMAIPDRVELPPLARGALIAEIGEALAFVTFTLEKAVIDLQDRLEHEINGQDHRS